MKNKITRFLIPILAFLALASCGRDSRPDILLITIDTLRKDHVGAYGYPRQTTPFIDSLARQGTLFQNAITPIPITVGSHASILTSLHPVTHRVFDNGDSLHQNVTTLAEVLKENGYHTIGTLGASILSSRRRFNQGFDSYSDKMGKHWQRSAREVNTALFQQIARYLDAGKKQPLFIWVHYFDPHTPYRDRGFTFKEDIPKHMLNGYKKNKDILNRYDSEIRFTDEAIRDLLQHLKHHKPDRKRVTCITADHGEQFGEHRGWSGHYDFYSETTHVPLILYGDNIPTGSVIRRPVSHMDIAVTLLNTAGLAFPNKTEGVDLLNPSKNKIKDRKFLVVGHPKDIKSVQLVDFPYSYILNFDHMYHHWFLTEKDIPPDQRFRKVPKESLHIEQGAFKAVTVTIPRKFQQGPAYLALKAGLTEKTFKKKIRVWFNQRLFTQWVTDRKMENFTLFHPVTTYDRLRLQVTLYLAQDTRVNELGYAFLSAKEFREYEGQLEKLDNRIVTKLRTQRKGSPSDELFDLGADVAMKRNLLDKENPAQSNRASLYKGILYKRFKKHFDKALQILGADGQRKKLSGKDLEMLKSLGYL